MNAEAAPAMTKNPPKMPRKPGVAQTDSIDLDRVVFDPEYRARVRDALNRTGRRQSIRPSQISKRKNRGSA